MQTRQSSAPVTMSFWSGERAMPDMDAVCPTKLNRISDEPTWNSITWPSEPVRMKENSFTQRASAEDCGWKDMVWMRMAPCDCAESWVKRSDEL